MTTERQPTCDTHAFRQDPIHDALTRLGVALVRVSYDGCSDNGCVDTVEVLDARDRAIELPNETVPYRQRHTTFDVATMSYTTTAADTETMPLAEALEQWCYDVLEQHHAGWENNEGAFGTLTISVGERRAQLVHNARVSDVHTTSTEV